MYDWCQIRLIESISKIINKNPSSVTGFIMINTIVTVVYKI